MFSFDFPVNCAAKVELPTGGHAIMVHVGGGRFISNMPPLVLAGVSSVEGVEQHGLPLGWDSKTLAGSVHHALFSFDTAAAARSVQDAAAAGDELAREVLGKMAAAEAMLEADDARLDHEAAGDLASAVRAEAVAAGVTDEPLLDALVAMTQTDDLRGMPAPADSRDSL